MASSAAPRAPDSDDELLQAEDAGVPDLDPYESGMEEEEEEFEDSEEEEEAEEMKEAPVTPEDLKDMGNQLYKAKDYRAAIDAYTQAIELDPSVATFYTNRASAHLMICQYEKTIEDCDRALERDPNLTKAYFRKAKALLTKGNAQEAIAAYTAGLIKDPTNAAAQKERKEAEQVAQRLQLAKNCLGEKNFSQAWRQIQIVDKAMPHSPEVQMVKIRALCGINRHQEAYSLTTSLLRTNPRTPGLLHMRATCLYYMDNVAQAIKHLQEAMRNDPDNTGYRQDIKKWRSLEQQKEAGNTAFKAGRFQPAIDAWSAALEIDPLHRAFNAKLLCNRATAKAKLRRHEEAVEDCGRAIELDPNYVKAYNRRADSLRMLDHTKERLQQAMRDYERAMELDSEEQQRSYKQKLRTVQAEIKRAGRKDYYKILGVARDADEDEIRKAFKKAALKWHPDRHSSKGEAEKEEAEKRFKDINEANEALTDPQKRARYDSGVDIEDLDNPHAGHGGGGMGGFSEADLYEMFMAQHGMGGFGGGGRRRASPFG